jgi:hypothetical protein
MRLAIEQMRSESAESRDQVNRVLREEGDSGFV